MGNLKFGTNDPAALYFGLSGSTKAYFGTTVVYESGETDYSKEYLTFEMLSGGTVEWAVKGENGWSGLSISYSVNNGEWQTLTANSEYSAVTLDAGDKIRFKGTNNRYNGGASYVYDYSNFSCISPLNIYGNIMSLTDGDNFSGATHVTSYTFRGLFDGIRVISAENLVLPATPLATGCYYGMFSGCTYLETPPELPSTALSANCYYCMFADCSSLQTAPELPATTLAARCYSDMFKGCTSLTTAPDLLAVDSADYCYRNMFSGCTSLSYIRCLLIDSSLNSTNSWVRGVSSSGTFVKNSGAEYWATGYNGIPSNWTVEEEGDYIKIAPSASTVGDGATSVTITVSASTDYTISTEDSWITLPASSGASGESTVLVAISQNTGSIRNGSIIFSNGTISKTFSLAQGVDYSQEYFTLEAVSSGTIAYTNTTTGFTADMSYSLNGGTWYGLSNGDSIMVSAGDKVRFKGTNTRLAESASYCTTFGGSAVMDAYGNIMSLINGDNFYGAEVPAGVTRMFGSLFAGSTGLRSAENLVLPSNVGAHIYNGTFSGCTSLIAAPALPATSLTDSCYRYMFRGCSSLQTAPELPTETLKMNCYSGMFYNCSNLNYIKCLATSISASNCTQTWVTGVSSSGTFVKNPLMEDWTTGTAGIPSGWTVEDAS